MKWSAIAGSWRKTNKQVEKDVRKTVRQILKSGKGIITGGALGVDFIATQEALQIDPLLTQLKIILPTTLKIYSDHYRTRAREEVITRAQAERLIKQLIKVKRINPNALVENKGNKHVIKKTYFRRIDKVIQEADELVAFHVNKSAGSQYTIDKAREKDIPIKIFSYQI